MNFTHRYPLNVPGKFYVDDQCTDCDFCRECAPNNIRRDDRYGQSYVFKQPETDEEVAATMEGVDGCPTNAVRSDGDQFDWSREPIIDWNAALGRFDCEVNFEISVPVIPHKETKDEERLAMENSQDGNPSPWWKKLLP
jgi:ferredoxin